MAQSLLTKARYHMLAGLAQLKYAPHPVYFRASEKESVKFWWSYFTHSFIPERGLFEYWGDDIGDLRWLWKNLSPGMTFMDVGAHHGVYSIIAAKRVGPKGRVIAFEPSFRERERFRRHLKSNDVECVTIEPYAVGAEGGVAELNIVDGEFTSMNSLRTPAVEQPTRKVEVKITTLDMYMRSMGLNHIDFMKIDVEGAELEAFRGAPHLLGHVRPTVLCEVLDLVTKPWGYPAVEIIDALTKLDYRWFDITADGGTTPHIRQASYETVKNYLAVPTEKC